MGAHRCLCPTFPQLALSVFSSNFFDQFNSMLGILMVHIFRTKAHLSLSLSLWRLIKKFSYYISGTHKAIASTQLA